MMLKSNLLKMLALGLVGMSGIFFSGCRKDSRNTVDVIPGSYKLERVEWVSPAATRADEAAVKVNLVNVDSLNVNGGVKVYVTGDGSTDHGTIHIELPLDYFVSRTFNLLSQWSPVQVPAYPVKYGKAWVVDVDYRVDHLGKVICAFDPATLEMFGSYLVDLNLDFDKQSETLVLNLDTNFGKGLNPAFFTKLVANLKCQDVHKFLQAILAQYKNPDSRDLFNDLKLNLDNKELEAYFQSLSDFLENYFSKVGSDYQSFFSDFFGQFQKDLSAGLSSQDFGKYLEDLFGRLDKQYEDDYEDFFEDFFEGLFNERYYQGTVRVVLNKK